MFKNTIIVVLAAVILSFGIAMKSAESEEEQPEAGYSDLERLEEKIDLLLKLMKEKDSAQISGKLDQVLSNQNKIINELGIIKVRASHR